MTSLTFTNYKVLRSDSMRKAGNQASWHYYFNGRYVVLTAVYAPSQNHRRTATPEKHQDEAGEDAR